MNGVEMNEKPKFILKETTYSSHAIIVEDTEGGGLLVIPLLTNGVISHFTCRKPTCSKYGYGDLPIIYFSVGDPEWDPSDQDHARY